MILIPMKNTWKNNLLKFIRRSRYCHNIQPDTLCTLCNTKHRHSRYICMAKSIKVFKAIISPIITAYHCKA